MLKTFENETMNLCFFICSQELMLLIFNSITKLNYKLYGDEALMALQFNLFVGN